MNNKFDGQRAYEFIKKINFNRLAGTKNEQKAANIIKEEFESFGLKAEFKKFKMATSHASYTEFKVLEPYEKTITISHRAVSGITPPQGIVTGFKYIESAGEQYCKDIENKVVMVTGRIDRYVCERLNRHKAIAVLVPMNYKQELFTIGYDIDFVTKFGNLPIAYISYDDALEMVKNNVTRVYIKIEDEVDFDAKGTNIISEIKGTLKPEEEILFIGHYDSVLNNGIFDNAAGSATVLEMARYFNNYPPKRTVKFILFSGEEMGLKGSKAYVNELKKNDENLKKIKMVFNFDLGGTILGRNCVRITGDNEIFNYIDAWNKIEDWDFLVEHDIYSSDNMPFGREGIPAINFYRSSLGLGHSLSDTIDHIAPEYFTIVGEFAIKLTSGIINAPILPFKRKVGTEMMKKIKEYFDRSSPEEPDEEKD